jgi:hypothetical protein
MILIELDRYEVFQFGYRRLTFVSLVSSERVLAFFSSLICTSHFTFLTIGMFVKCKYCSGVLANEFYSLKD